MSFPKYWVGDISSTLANSLREKIVVRSVYRESIILRKHGFFKHEFGQESKYDEKEVFYASRRIFIEYDILKVYGRGLSVGNDLFALFTKPLWRSCPKTDFWHTSWVTNRLVFVPL